MIPPTHVCDIFHKHIYDIFLERFIDEMPHRHVYRPKTEILEHKKIYNLRFSERYSCIVPFDNICPYF